jgi:hypothetical protein
MPIPKTAAFLEQQKQFDVNEGNDMERISDQRALRVWESEGGTVDSHAASNFDQAPAARDRAPRGWTCRFSRLGSCSFRRRFMSETGPRYYVRDRRDRGHHTCSHY